VDCTEEKWGPPGPCSSHLALDTPCLGPVGLETCVDHLFQLGGQLHVP
jgi:hypothetical protein